MKGDHPIERNQAGTACRSNEVHAVTESVKITVRSFVSRKCRDRPQLTIIVRDRGLEPDHVQGVGFTPVLPAQPRTWRSPPTLSARLIISSPQADL